MERMQKDSLLHDPLSYPLSIRYESYRQADSSSSAAERMENPGITANDPHSILLITILPSLPSDVQHRFTSDARVFSCVMHNTFAYRVRKRNSSANGLDHSLNLEDVEAVVSASRGYGVKEMLKGTAKKGRHKRFSSEFMSCSGIVEQNAA